MRIERRTWAEILSCHREAQPDRLLYRFLPDGEAAGAVEWSFAAVDRQARAVAAMLNDRGARGQRVLLVHPPGLAFAAAFLGCLYAGAVAVPTFLPRSAGQERQSARLAAIVASAQPLLVATTAQTLERCESLFAPLRTTASHPFTLIATDTLDADAGERWTPPAIDGDALACLQYTSGTSGTPKGVMLTHDSLLANCAQIAERFGHTSDSRGVIWLPPYHDMGLVGGILQPLYVGFDVTLMPPAAFLQHPIRWLRAISTYRATTSGGPNFAYELCADSLADASIADLDLSTWDVAFVGAEPVRAATMRRFAERFARCGFSDRAFLPCYGLAEATLIVSGTRKGTGIQTMPSPGSVGECVSCGPAASGASIVIIDPTTSKPMSDGHEGEVCVSSPSIAAGYWRQPDLTAQTFVEGEPRQLRTGDLGFVRDGELFVTGRLKDLIIVRGVNHSPDDLEQTAQAAHAALQPHGGAAFAIADDAGEVAVIVHELRREQRSADPMPIVNAIRADVADVHGLELSAVVLVRPGSVLRTPSGKVQRNACRIAYLAEALDPIFTWSADRPDAETKVAPTVLPVAQAQAASPDVQLSQWLAARVAGVIGCTADQIDIAEPLARYGIGSADAVGLAGQISDELGVDLPAMALWDYPTLRELTRHLIDEAGVTAVPAARLAPAQVSK